MKTLFKSQSAKDNDAQILNQQIDQSEVDIQFYEKIVKMVEVHITETVIPEFRSEKMSNYYKILLYFSNNEIEHANTNAAFWTELLSNTNLKHF